MGLKEIIEKNIKETKGCKSFDYKLGYMDCYKGIITAIEKESDLKQEMLDALEYYLKLSQQDRVNRKHDTYVQSLIQKAKLDN